MEARRSWKTLAMVAALVTGLPTIAFAQALQVFVFGDAGVVAQSGMPTPGTDTPGTALSMKSGPWQASRLGFRGKLKLTDDFDGWYDAASTINLTQGTIGNNVGCSVAASTITVPAGGGTVAVPASPAGTAIICNQFFLFDRNAFVGFSSAKYGSLTFGRHPTVLAETMYVADPLKANNGATNPNVRFGYLVAPGALIYQNFGTNTANNNNGASLDRQSNALRYLYYNSGFAGMLGYGFGGVAGDRARNMYAGGLIGYDSDGAATHGPIDRGVEGYPAAFSIRLAGQLFNDNGLHAGTDAAPNVVSLYSWAAGVVGRYDPFKLKLTYTYNTIDNDSFYKSLTTKVAAAGVTYSYSDLDLTVAVYNVNRKMTGQPYEDATKLYFVPEWYITKNFWVYGIVDYEILNSQAAFSTANGVAGTGVSNSSIGPIDAGATSGNTLVQGVQNELYIGLGVSFILTS